MLYFLPPDRPVPIEEYLHSHYHYARTVPRVAHSTVMTREGRAATVSTIFLFTDMSFGRGVRPILWETMAFGPVLDEETWRHASPEAASAGHREALALVRTALDLAETPELVTVTYRGSWWRNH